MKSKPRPELYFDDYVMARVYLDASRPSFKGVAIRSLDDECVFVVEDPQALKTFGLWLIAHAETMGGLPKELSVEG